MNPISNQPSAIYNHPSGITFHVSRVVSRRLVLALCLAAWVLLTAGLAAQSLWIDEWYTANAAAMDWGDFLPTVIETERRPPLHYALVKVWQGAAGTSEFAMRVFSTSAAVLLVPLTYQLARRVAGRPAGRLAAALAAFSPFLLLYGRMVRSYALFAVLAVAATLALLRLAERNSAGRWAAYAALAAALLYVDYGGVAVVGAHALWLALRLWPRPQWGVLARQASPVVVAGAAFLPWAGVLVHQSVRSVTSGIAADLSGGVLGVALKLVFPFTALAAGETLYPWHPLGLLAIVLCGLLALNGLWGLWREQRALAVLMAAWIGLGVVFTTVVLSAIAVDITFLNAASRAPHLAPAYAVLVAAGLARLRPRWRVGALVALAAAFGLALANYYLGREFLNPIYAVPTRAVAAEVSAQATAEDVIVAEPDTLFGYYYQQAPGPAAYADTDLAANQALITARAPRRIWVVSFGRDRTAGTFDTEALLAWLAEDYTLAEQRGYGEVGPTYRWVKERLLNREAYWYKLVVMQFERSD